MTSPGGRKLRDKNHVSAWQNFKYDVADFCRYYGFEFAIALAIVVVLLISAYQQ